MRPIQLRGKTLDSVFELLGSDENSLTLALGWCLSRVPGLLEQVATELGVKPPGAAATVRLQDAGGRNGITDVEVQDPGKSAWIVEAKVGFDPPGLVQLTKYARKLLEQPDGPPSKLLVVLAQSDRKDLWLKLKVPASVEGVPVRVISWGQVRGCIERAYPETDNTGKGLLRQLGEFLDKVLPMQEITSNSVYVVSVSRDTFSGGPTTFLDVVLKHGMYFHPIGNNWPVSPPNYMAFRWDGCLQSIHHVDRYEILTNFRTRFEDADDVEFEPLFLYHLGPAIRPAQKVPTGNLFRAARISAHLDLLLTAPSISEAGVLTRQRIEAARR